MTLRTAVVGAGTVSDIHLSGLAACPRTELVAVCDLDETRAKASASTYGIQPYVDLGELLDAEDLDWLHVCTSVQSHLDVARTAIEAGVAVEIEKPVAETVAEVDELQSVSDRHDVPVSVVHQHLFDPAMRRARERIQSGEIGDVVAVDLLYTGETLPDEPNRGSWTFDLVGGEFEEGLPHPLYLLLGTGGHPRSEDDVHATTTLRGEYDQSFGYDGVALQYRTDDDVVCSATMLAGSAPQRMVFVHGEEGSFTVDTVSQTIVDVGHDYNGSPAAKLRNNVRRAFDRVTGTARNLRLVADRKFDGGWESQRAIDPHYYQFDAEARAIESGSEVPVTLEEARWTISLMNRIADVADDDQSDDRAHSTPPAQ